MSGRRHGDPEFAERLRRETQGDVLFDPFSRGRYSTDASHYQIEPIGALAPRTWDDVRCAIQIAAEFGVPVVPRGAGTSQCGQTIGAGLVIDVSKYLNRLVSVDESRRTAVVEPGIVLDALNTDLASRGLMFPVDVSTASRATIGGMTGNNSCGTRSIRYGTMRDNVHGVDAILADGRQAHFGIPANTTAPESLVSALFDLGRREAEEIRHRFPDLMRRVGGYNLDALTVSEDPNVANLSHLLVGSEGTLAFTEQVHLALHPLPAQRTLGVCHFPRFYAAMDAAQHLVKLQPSAVELVDRTMIELSRDIPLYRATVDRFVRGHPEALLLVEFAGEDHAEQVSKLDDLRAMMDSLGLHDAVIAAIEPEFQKAIWEVRKSGLNIMMSMKGDGKPISFIEDCAVRLEDLAEYTDRLTRVFEKHGTTGTWYAHASVGCLHVRPVLNLKLEADTKKMRAIAEEAFDMVREYKGSHSGEHGDGLVRSEFHETMFGTRMVRNFAEVKHLLDPNGLMNPGKIVGSPKMDDRNLFRFKPGYRVERIDTALDWSAWGGLSGAVEMCNNNGACRKFDANVMCPSYRATREEQHLTRGRANSLRLALSGQLGNDALTSQDMYETMRLCISCKGCKRECPTGVDMAKM
ncbi:MAG: FAD-binding protein, partial [Gammaproteobacteria bacterium]|nr:FAD-binding protein [Gammaproteobacteria bacterium]